MWPVHRLFYSTNLSNRIIGDQKEGEYNNQRKARDPKEISLSKSRETLEQKKNRNSSWGVVVPPASYFLG
jgi:hypothetical protein